MKAEVGNSNAMSSLCTIIRDSNLTWAKILDRMQNYNFGSTDDVSLAKTHPNELFLKANMEHVHERRFKRHEFSEALQVHAVER